MFRDLSMICLIAYAVSVPLAYAAIRWDARRDALSKWTLEDRAWGMVLALTGPVMLLLVWLNRVDWNKEVRW